MSDVFVSFPNRAWEPASSGDGWVSRPVTSADLQRRKELLSELGATVPAPEVEDV